MHITHKSLRYRYSENNWWPNMYIGGKSYLQSQNWGITQTASIPPASPAQTMRSGSLDQSPIKPFKWRLIIRDDAAAQTPLI